MDLSLRNYTPKVKRFVEAARPDKDWGTCHSCLQNVMMVRRQTDEDTKLVCYNCWKDKND